MAAYTSLTLIPYGATQANMVALAQFIFGSVLTGAGWVQTGDTGQQASDSWPAVTSVNTSNGYQVWRMADALQGTYPVFMKIELGSSTAASIIAFWITIGTGSDGAGSITGTLLARTQFGNYSGSTTAFPSYGSGSTSRFNWALWLNASTANSAFYWGIERSKDATGADSNHGLIIQSMAGTSSPKVFWTQYIPFSGTAVAAKSQYLSCLHQSLWSTNLGDGAGNIITLPIYPWSLQGHRYAGSQLRAYYGPDFAAMNPFYIIINGVSHVYYAMGPQNTWATTFTSYPSLYPMFQYE